MISDYRLKDFMYYPNMALRLAMTSTYQWKGSSSMVLTEKQQKQGKLLKGLLRFGFLFGAINVIYQNFGMIVYITMKILKNDENDDEDKFFFGDISEAGGILGLSLVGTCKMCMIYGYDQRIQYLLEEFEKIFPKRKTWNYRFFRVDDFLKQSCDLMKLTMVFFLFAFTYYNLLPILELIYELVMPNMEFKYRYQSFTWYPWQNNSNQKSIVNYIAAYICQVFSSLSGVAFIMAGEFLMCFFITQIQMHIEYLASSLEKLDASEPYANERLKYLLNYHNRLLQYSKEINEIFNISFLVNFATSSMAICLMCFSMVMISITHAAKYAVGLMSFLIFTLFICYNGNEFTDAGNKLMPAAFYSNWYNGDKEYRKMILIFIIRAREPNYLRAYKFQTVSMETYMNILKVSYQLFTFFRAMLQQN